MGVRGLWGAGLPGSGVVLFEETGVCADRDDVILRLSHLGDAAECSVDTQREIKEEEEEEEATSCHHHSCFSSLRRRRCEEGDPAEEQEEEEEEEEEEII